MRTKAASQAQSNPAAYLNTYANDLGTLLRGATCLNSHNRDDEAAQLLQRAVIVDPSCATAVYQLDLYYAKRAQMTRAEKLVERALELCPGDKRCLAILHKIRQTPMSVHKLRLEEKRGTKKHAFVQISNKVVLKEKIRDSSR